MPRALPSARAADAAAHGLPGEPRPRNLISPAQSSGGESRAPDVLNHLVRIVMIGYPGSPLPYHKHTHVFLQSVYALIGVYSSPEFLLLQHPRCVHIKPQNEVDTLRPVGTVTAVHRIRWIHHDESISDRSEIFQPEQPQTPLIANLSENTSFRKTCSDHLDQSCGI